MKVFNVGTMTAAVLTTDIGVFRVWRNGSIEVKSERSAGGYVWAPFAPVCYDYDVPDILIQAARDAA